VQTGTPIFCANGASPKAKEKEEIMDEAVTPASWVKEAKKNGGWGWTFFSGLVTLFLGGLIWSQWPLSGIWAVGTLVGIHLIFDGWAEIAVASAARAEISDGGTGSGDLGAELREEPPADTPEVSQE
jgi:hypothetical protein